MIECEECGLFVPEDELIHCPECGKVFCPECHMEMSNEHYEREADSQG